MSYSSVSLDLKQLSNFELCVSLKQISDYDRCFNLLRSEVNRKLHHKLLIKFSATFVQSPRYGGGARGNMCIPVSHLTILPVSRTYSYLIE